MLVNNKIQSENVPRHRFDSSAENFITFVMISFLRLVILDCISVNNIQDTG